MAVGESESRPLEVGRVTDILVRLGVELPRDARILDFGCGAGQMVYRFVDAGYANVFGYDVADYVDLRDPADRPRFFTADGASPAALPFEDDSFDFVISVQVFEHVLDQVRMLRELHRIMRPGGHALHLFPAEYCPVEGHMFVPLGNVVPHRWWYKLWALLGIRNGFQQGLSADETADRNAFYYVEGLNYISTSCYKVVWTRLGYEWKWIDQEAFDTSDRAIVRAAGRLNRILPLIAWLSRVFRARRVYLRKQD